MRRRLPIVVMAIAVLAAGCGGGKATTNGEEKKPPDQVAHDAQQAALQAKTVHATGTLVRRGVPLRFDIRLTPGAGSATLTEQTTRLDIVRVGGKLYLRGSDESVMGVFAAAGGVHVPPKKWVWTRQTTGAFGILVPLTDKKQLFGNALGQHGKLENRGMTTYKGRKAVAIVDTTRGGTLYVAAVGPPYPLGLTRRDKSSIAFDEWNTSARISAPPGAVKIG